MQKKDKRQKVYVAKNSFSTHILEGWGNTAKDAP